MLGGVPHGAFLHLGNARGNADDHAVRGLKQPLARVNHLNHALNHFLGGVEIGNYAILQGADGANVIVRFLVHLLGLAAHGDDFIGGAVFGDDARLIHHDFIVMNNERIGRTQVDGDVAGQEIKETH